MNCFPLMSIWDYVLLGFGFFSVGLSLGLFHANRIRDKTRDATAKKVIRIIKKELTKGQLSHYELLTIKLFIANINSKMEEEIKNGTNN